MLNFYMTTTYQSSRKANLFWEKIIAQSLGFFIAYNYYQWYGTHILIFEMCIIVNAQVQWYVTSKEFNHDDKYYGLLNKTLVNIHSKPLDSVRPSTMPQLRKINRCYQIFHKHQNNCFPFRNLDSIYYRNLVINFCFVFLF